MAHVVVAYIATAHIVMTYGLYSHDLYSWVNIVMAFIIPCAVRRAVPSAVPRCAMPNSYGLHKYGYI